MKKINYREKPQSFFENIMLRDIEEKGQASRWLLDYTCYLRNKLLKLEKQSKPSTNATKVKE